MYYYRHILRKIRFFIFFWGTFVSFFKNPVEGLLVVIPTFYGNGSNIHI